MPTKLSKRPETYERLHSTGVRLRGQTLLKRPPGRLRYYTPLSGQPRRFRVHKHTDYPRRHPDLLGDPGLMTEAQPAHKTGGRVRKRFAQHQFRPAQRRHAHKFQTQAGYAGQFIHARIVPEKTDRRYTGR